LRSSFRRSLGWSEAGPAMPTWLSATFVDHLDLRSRWARIWSESASRRHHPSADSLSMLQEPQWSALFGDYDALPVPVETRYPFLDLRLVRFLLSAPFPVKVNKWVLRRSMKARLPAEVSDRPKTPLRGDLCHSRLHGAAPLDRLDGRLANAAPRWVDGAAYRACLALYAAGPPAASTWGGLQLRAPVAFDYWLRDLGT